MLKKRGFRQWLFAVLLVVSLTAGGLFVVRASDVGTPFHILLISSYDYSYTTIPDQLSGFKQGLKGIPLNIDYEFMDAKNFYKASDIDEFQKYISYKIEHSDPFDLIVLLDDTALHFALNNASELFPDVPMVFMGINNLTDAKTAAALPNVTGVAEVLDFEDNLALIKELFPDRDNLVVIIDNTNSSLGEFVSFERFAEAHPEIRYRVINMSYYSQKGLHEALSEIDNTSVILYLDCIEDGDGNAYTLRSATSMISKYAPDAPIWRLSISELGSGAFGGLSYSYADAGQIAGKMAASILTKSATPQDLPLVTDSVTEGIFDQNAMDHFGINIRQLPPGSKVINEHDTLFKFYRENTLMMNLIFLIILLMIAVIVLLVVANRRREKLIHEDFLTRMPNRTYITEQIAAVTESHANFGLIMIDVDKFKTINDTLGHLVGDELLVGVASRLKSLPSKDIVVARIGGDEFMGLIKGANQEKAETLCQKIIRIMSADFDSSEGPLHITVSVGAAVYPDDTLQAGSVMGLADEALYDVKEHGRDGYRLYRHLHRDNR